MANGVLIDLSGVLYSGDALLPGAKEALTDLRRANMPLRFLTNSTRKPKRVLLEQMARYGIEMAASELFTPAKAACDWLGANGYAPHLLVHPDLNEDFADCTDTGPRALVLGDAGPFFTYEVLNEAYRVLESGAPFLALATNRVFTDADGQLSMDVGAFAAALEYSSGTKPVLLGKPAKGFFEAAANSMGLALEQVAMIGDDAEADVAGALTASVGSAILVRTGKYRPGDETRFRTRPTATVAGIRGAADLLLR